MAGSVMPMPRFFRSDVTWASLNRDGTIPSVNYRLTSFVMIAAKTSLYSFRRVVEMRSLGDILAQEFNKIMTNKRDDKIDTVYCQWSPVNIACCCWFSVLK